MIFCDNHVLCTLHSYICFEHPYICHYVYGIYITKYEVIYPYILCDYVMTFIFYGRYTHKYEFHIHKCRCFIGVIYIYVPNTYI